MNSFSNLIRPLTKREYSILKDDIKLRGIKYPIIVSIDGRIVDGFHRNKIAKELKIHCPRIIEDLPEEELEAMARSLNYARRHMSDEERDSLIIEGNKAKKSTRHISQEIGVSQATVNRVVRRESRDSPENTDKNDKLFPDKIIGTDGKTYSARKQKEYKPPHERDLKVKPLYAIASMTSCAGTIKKCLEDNDVINKVNRDAMLQSAEILQEQIGIMVRILDPKKLRMVGEK